MNSKVGLVRTAVVSAIFLGGFGVSAWAQEADAAAEASVVLETFDSGDPSAMLGGQIDLVGDALPWILHVSEGKFVVENRTEAQSIHYNDISYVKYPDSGSLELTENSVISAMVDPRNEGSGGCGIYFGNGDAGFYLAFLLDAQGQYHVVRKLNGKVKRLHSGTADAIKAGEANEVSLAWRGGSLVFFANGTEVINVPYDYTPGTGEGGLGLAAFGIGSYYFDDVEFSRAN